MVGGHVGSHSQQFFVEIEGFLHHFDSSFTAIDRAGTFDDRQFTVS